MDGCLACRGAEAATVILEKTMHVSVEKAIDPLNPHGFMRIVAQLRRALSGIAAQEQGAALRAAMQGLDVDWRRISGTQRSAVIEAARQAIGAGTVHMLPRITQTFQIVGPRIAGESRRSSMRRFGLDIGASLTEPDTRAIEYVRRSTTAFVTDHLGVRRDELAQSARDIVASGLEEGLGSDDIAQNLAAHLGASIQRSQSYWQVVAMAFTNTARTYSQLGAFHDAGIQRFVFEAILDEVTSDICRYYHGRTFEVGAAHAQIQQQATHDDPEQVRESNPWIRRGRDEDGNSILFYERGGERVTVAQVDRSGVGSSDDTGDYSHGMTSPQLQAAGIPYPPLHGRCRSTIVPDV